MTAGRSIDAAMRTALLAAAARDSASIHRDLMTALDRGPHPDTQAVMQRYGADLPAATRVIGRLIDRLEVAIVLPVSFTQWIARSGYGDDPLIFEVFLRWAQITDPARKFTSAIRYELVH